MILVVMMSPYLITADRIISNYFKEDQIISPTNQMKALIILCIINYFITGLMNTIVLLISMLINQYNSYIIALYVLNIMKEHEEANNKIEIRMLKVRYWVELLNIIYKMFLVFILIIFIYYLKTN